MPQHIAPLDAHVRQSAPEPGDTAIIDIEGCEVAAEPGQSGSEGSVAGTDLEDGAVGRGDEIDDAVDGGTVDEEVLAEFMTAAVG